MGDTGYVLEPPPSDDQPQAPAQPPPAQTPQAPTDAQRFAEQREGALEGTDDGGEEEQQPPPRQERRRTIVNDLQEERQARRQADERAARLEAEANQMRPIVNALAAHPNGVAMLQALVQGQPLPPPQQTGPDPELVSIAEDLGLYTLDGQPDLVKAGRIAQRQAHVARQAVQQAVQPMQQQTVSERAHVGRNALWTQAHQPENKDVDPGVLGELLKLLPDQLIADQGVQSLVWTLATGATTLQRNRGQAPPVPQPQPGVASQQPPVFTESAGGRVRPQTQLAAPFQALLKKAGLTDKDVQTSLGKYVPGAPNALE